MIQCLGTNVFAELSLRTTQASSSTAQSQQSLVHMALCEVRCVPDNRMVRDWTAQRPTGRHQDLRIWP